MTKALQIWQAELVYKANIYFQISQFHTDEGILSMSKLDQDIFNNCLKWIFWIGRNGLMFINEKYLQNTYYAQTRLVKILLVSASNHVGNHFWGVYYLRICVIHPPRAFEYSILWTRNYIPHLLIHIGGCQKKWLSKFIKFTESITQKKCWIGNIFMEEHLHSEGVRCPRQGGRGGVYYQCDILLISQWDISHISQQYGMKWYKNIYLSYKGICINI